MVIIRKISEVPEYDVREAYGQDAEGVTIRWITDSKTGGDEYLHNFALRYFVFKPGGYMALHQHPWEQEIAVTKGKFKILGGQSDEIVEAGDVAYFPADEDHGFQNIGDETGEFYCVIGCIGKGENCIGIVEE